MAKMFLTLLCCLLFIIPPSNAIEPCPFATECLCGKPDQGVVNVLCDGISNTFPKFKAARYVMISSLTIAGNFTNIPNHAFYDLDTSIIDIIFNRTRDPELPLTIDPDAFTLANTTLLIYAISFINMKGLDNVPNGLNSTRGLTELSFSSCGIETLLNNSFEGMNINTLNIVDNGLKIIEENAFSGIEISLTALNLHQNELIEIPEAMKKLIELRFAYLNNNKIAQLFNNSFPSSVYAIFLSFNPIADIDDDAFENIKRLTSLQLNNCNLTAVPNQILHGSVLNVLTFEMKSNQITIVTSNDFSQPFPNMQNLPALDDNPIQEIEDGAFSGLTNVNSVYITDLFELKAIDLNIFSPMTRLNHVYLDQFRKLENISANGVLSSDLHYIEISNVDRIMFLDTSFENWLNNSSVNVLSITNDGIRCNEGLNWLNEYVFCSFHPQIKMDGTICSERKLPLKGYLAKKFDRNCA